MAVCDFLIIGAMKAGTTSLYRDLRRHPDLFLPEQKEPELLCRGLDETALKRAYARLFRKAGPGSLRGEASTAYTKRPDHPVVAQTARALFGPGLKVVYMEREPVSRAISHYRHNFLEGTQDLDIDQALTRCSKYVDYGRYEWQLQPWLEAFGPGAILRVRFEDFIADRDLHVRRVCRYLGADPARLPALEARRIYNSSSDKRVATGPSRALLHSRWYRDVIKPWLPHSVRAWLKRRVLPRAADSPEIISEATRSYLLEQFGQPAGSGEA